MRVRSAIRTDRDAREFEVKRDETGLCDRFKYVQKVGREIESIDVHCRAMGSCDDRSRGERPGEDSANK